MTQVGPEDQIVQMTRVRHKLYKRHGHDTFTTNKQTIVGNRLYSNNIQIVLFIQIGGPGSGSYVQVKIKNLKRDKIN